MKAIQISEAPRSIRQIPKTMHRTEMLYLGKKQNTLLDLQNFSVMNFNLMGASFAATAAGSLLETSGGFLVPVLFLLCLAVVSLILDLCIKKP